MSRHSSLRIDLKCASLSFLRHTKTYLFDFLSAVVNETSYFFFWALANKHQVSGLLMLLCTVFKNQVLDCKQTFISIPNLKRWLTGGPYRRQQGSGGTWMSIHYHVFFLLFSILSSKPLQGPPSVSNLPK